MEPARWLRLAYKLADDPDSEQSRLAMQLADVLKSGASTLEIARKTRHKTEVVAPLLDLLREFEVVKAESSGLSVSGGDKFYSLTSDGVRFFRELGALRRRTAL